MQIITQEQRFGRAAMVGVSGGMVALLIVLTDRMFYGDWGFVRAAFMGAFIAGYLLARGFGGDGAWGWFRAGLTFAACTVLGAAIAVPLLEVDEWLMGTAVMEQVVSFAGMSVLGPVYVLGMLGEHYLVWAVWAAAFIAAQGQVVWGR